MVNTFDISVTIGSIGTNRISGLEIVSERHTPVSLYYIILRDTDRDVFKSVSIDTPVTITITCDGQPEAVWAGTVSSINASCEIDHIIIKCSGIESSLMTGNIIQSWSNESPEAIINWALSQTGNIPGNISSPGCIFPLFTSSGLTVYEIVKQCEYTCEKSFNIDMSEWSLFMDSENRVNWGNIGIDSDVIEFKTGSGIIQHTPSDSVFKMSVLETYLTPTLMHSMSFTVLDNLRDFSCTFRASKVVHSYKDGKARTFIGYGVENGKY